MKTVLMYLLVFIISGMDLAAKTSINEVKKVPFQLILEKQGKKLIGSLKNITQFKQSYLLDSRIQSTILVMIDSNGKKQDYFDVRSIMKYDNTPYLRMINVLLPNEKKTIHESIFEKSSINWQNCKYKEIKKGKYKLFLEWKSTITDFYDDEKQTFVKIPVWINSKPIVSNIIEVEVP